MSHARCSHASSTAEIQLVAHPVGLSDKGLSEQVPGKIIVKGLAKHRLVPGRGQMVVLVDPSLSENEVPDEVDSR